ncbi:MAG: hypothetical protein IJO55_04950 [Lachnospiraceae bacterium]|nr:hypothetical protein [Lachnospiraceae bacterium]MBQ6855953.1 hypothetical protein [Lachnospiraceae bacterium]
MKRILAWIGILAIAAAFLALVYCTATGASANVILAIIVAMILVPIIIYGFIMAAKAFSKKEDSSADN